MTLEEAVQDLKNVKVYSFILKQILAFLFAIKMALIILMCSSY
jgi:hypothetical protein